MVQKVIKVNEVIEKEIRPALERDGGSIELADIEGNIVKVRLKTPYTSRRSWSERGMRVQLIIVVCFMWNC